MTPQVTEFRICHLSGTRESGVGIRDSGVGIRDSGFGARGSGLWALGSGFGIRDSMVQSSEFRVQGSGFGTPLRTGRIVQVLAEAIDDDDRRKRLQFELEERLRSKL